MLFAVSLACLLSITTIAIHALGTAWGLHWLRAKREYGPARLKTWHITWLMCQIGLLLLMLQFVEATCWALAYRWLTGIEQLGTMEEALYFSMVTFSSLGYGDIVLETPYRILSGLEAMNGCLIVGWSAAFFFAVLERTWRDHEVFSQDL